MSVHIGRQLQDAEAAAKKELPVAQAHLFVTLLGEIDGLTNSLAGQITTEAAARFVVHTEPAQSKETSKR